MVACPVRACPVVACLVQVCLEAACLCLVAGAAFATDLTQPATTPSLMSGDAPQTGGKPDMKAGRRGLTQNPGANPGPAH